MIEQLSVLLSNEQGRLGALAKLLGDNNISMHALTIAEAGDFGVVRIICDTPGRAKELLDGAGFQSSVSEIQAVDVPDVAGGLVGVLQEIESMGENIEYAYCFESEAHGAKLVLKTK